MTWRDRVEALVRELDKFEGLIAMAFPRDEKASDENALDLDGVERAIEAVKIARATRAKLKALLGQRDSAQDYERSG